METTFGFIDTASKIVLGIVGLVISWAVYRQTQERAEETWIRTYADFHESFWNDPVVHEVRCWLAYPLAYKPLKATLIKRLAQGTRELQQEEYITLDKLDKYLNTLLRAVTVNPELTRDRDLFVALHFKYWLSACLDIRRSELREYVGRFYEPLYEFGTTPEFYKAAEQLGFQLQEISKEGTQQE